MEYISTAQSPVNVRSADSSILLKLSASSGCNPEGDKTNEKPYKYRSFPLTYYKHRDTRNDSIRHFKMSWSFQK